MTTPQGGGWLKVSPGTGTAGDGHHPDHFSGSDRPEPGTYNGSVAVTAAGATQSVAVTYTVNSSGTGGGATRVLPQFAFGGGWYSALYFTNTTGSAVSFTVTFTGDNGQPLSVPALGGSTVTVNLAPRGTAIVEAPNSGSLSQGYVSVALPGGVTGYGVFRQSLQGLPDQEAVVPLSGTTATTSTLIFDDSNGKETAVAVVNLSSFDTVVTAVARDNQGNNLEAARLPFQPGRRKPWLSEPSRVCRGVVGNMGSVDLTVNSGNLFCPVPGHPLQRPGIHIDSHHGSVSISR